MTHICLRTSSVCGQQMPTCRRSARSYTRPRRPSRHSCRAGRLAAPAAGRVHGASQVSAPGGRAPGRRRVAQPPPQGASAGRSGGARPNTALWCAGAGPLRHAPYQASGGAGRPAGQAVAAAGAGWPRRACAARRGAHAKPPRPQGRRRRWPHTHGTGRALGTPQIRLTSERGPPCLRAQAGESSPQCWSWVREPWAGGPWPTRGGQRACPRPGRWRAVSASPLWGSACRPTVAVRRGLRALDHA